MKKKTKQLLIETGAKLVTKLGYNGSGLNMILKEAKMPKGSFYYHFGSKEEFGVEIIKYLGELFLAEMEKVLSGNGSQRKLLLKYFESQVDRLDRGRTLKIEPLIRLSTEMATVLPSFNKELTKIFDKATKMVQIALEKARIAGENDLVDTDAYVAGYLMDAWTGAVVTSTVRKDSDAMERFVDYAFNWLVP